MMGSGDGRIRDYDVVVIGAGLAGLVAAARAAAGGATVGVVSVSSGNLGLWSGLVGRKTPATAEELEAARFFLAFSERASLPYRLAEPPGFRLLSPGGRVVSCALAPATAVAGNLEADGASAPGLLLAGFVELGDYPAAFIAARAEAVTGLPVASRSVSLGAAAARGLAPRVARLFDDRAWFRGFLATVRRALGGELGEAWAVGFPPVLGFVRFGENRLALEEAFGRPVFELPAVPASVPGERFGRLWRHRLETDGLTSFHLGRRVAAAGVEKSRCLWVADGSCRYRARAFVLATGGVAGGGLLVPSGALAPGSRATRPAEPTLEPVFGLETRGAGTDWSTWGVLTTPGGRPFARRTGLGPEREPLENVFVAGWQLGAAPGTGGPDALSSIVSGWRAGCLALDAASGEGGGRP